ncbi:hypothetical protein F3Y22_tig00111101pilonHSYRG00048 [Hibiscus syriacus]|uniref:DUF3741 domain-containing protein n=1 Tax=Hibiscus syriacus TaxID=106335 RepID=A0A6A2YZY8_HIBSY|nr:uncharacterized protein LOC120153632 [Hibiscus syriacus]XP_039021474.1 uncharacterized protein LOC120153632 [Hibiscus syriacus]KAE8685056.1 hypothetical protein F3Y22_tig00111101pilonHSYRG00048 [Hibiscus syriacus]
MNGFENKRGQNIEKFPGCLGRMVNLFDLNTSVPGNRLLTDKQHDGSSVSRSQSGVARMSRPTFGDQNHQIEDKVILSKIRRAFSDKKDNGTPVKMLIAREMSKEAASKHNPPNLVAKLMGLDTLPRRQHNLSAQRCHSKGFPQQSSSHSGTPVERWEQDQGFADKEMLSEINPCQELNKYIDVNEIRQQSPMATYSRDSSPQKWRYKDNVNEKKMALVHQKFMEAKHLVTDEKLRQTKEFQEALEVLSSNRELFLKFLKEPNSKFSQHHYGFQSLSQPPEKMRITVLRPKMIEKENFAGIGSDDKQTKKSVRMGRGNGWDRKNESCDLPFPSPEVDEYPSRPTRIVVLKPSPGKSPDIKTVASPSPSSPRILLGDDFFKEPEHDGAQEPREVAKEMQLRENLIGHRRDETLLSSVFSNGYVGDDSSLSRFENEYAVESLSDSEVTSPTSRHSWDYINRFSSPYSSSSFSHTSCSPESSVFREAKKRLSERWTMMASNGNFQEQRYVRRSSNTLGGMLALSDTKKLVRSEEEGSTKEQEPRGSTSYIASNLNKEENKIDSPKNLLRSKSVPVLYTAYRARLNIEFSDPESSKEQVPKELTKAKSMKSSLKGKVSNLFFSKNKKTNKEKSIGSQTAEESPSTTPGTLSHPQKINNDAPQCIKDSCNQVHLSPVLGGSVSKTPSPDLTGMGQKQCMTAVEGGLSVAKPSILVRLSENMDQPSPTSILEPLFDEDENTSPESSGSIKPVHQGVELPPKSILIDKSPPIESIARTLSWDDSCSETPTMNSSKPSKVSSGVKEKEYDLIFSVQSLLSAAGLNGKVCFESCISRWHSPESPLDPSLREKYANSNDKEHLHEAKLRQWRSHMNLVFDCVNAAVLEITGYGSSSCMRNMSLGWSHMRDTESSSSSLVDHVCAQMKEWNGMCLVDDEIIVSFGWLAKLYL